MHAQFTGGAALVAFVFLEDRENEAFFKFTDGLGIKDVALVHLHDEGFELILHGLSLSLLRLQYENLRTYFLLSRLRTRAGSRSYRLCDMRSMEHVQSLIKLFAQLGGGQPNRSPAHNQEIRSEL